MEPPSSTDPLPVINHFASTYLVGFIVLVALLLFSAFLSGAETAFFSVSRSDAKEKQSPKSSLFAKALRLLSAPNLLFSSIQVVYTFTTTLVVLLVAYLFIPYMYILNSMEGVLALAVLTILSLLLFVEVIPKVVAAHVSQAYASIAAYPIRMIIVLIQPVVKLANKMYMLVDKRSGSYTKSEPFITDLSEAIAIAHNQTAEDKKLLKSIINLVGTEVRKIMRPRVDISAVSAAATFDELYAFILDCGYSRIPVYDENIDDIKGVLYIKDLLPYFDATSASFSWTKLIRPTYFIPESKLTNDLLAEFQQKRMLMAIVVDEYGATSGIVTLEDILEEIVGEILDESDVLEDEEKYVSLKDGTFVFDGKVTLFDFCRIVNVEKELFVGVEDDVDTLGGLLLNLKGDLPDVGEVFSFKDMRFEVLKVDDRRVSQIKVLLEHEDDE